ncbi:MAG: Ppx/GppA phosphatase family protein [Nitrospinota bacterium]|nr:Ppx/GppA phosphatase family protein [Nitrospinota bacterium]
MKKFASIDIGTNTVRLLILETDAQNDFNPVDSERVITRLGEGMDTEKRILENRISTTLTALSNFRDRCRAHGDIPIQAVATSAVREAENGDEFVQRARELTGIRIQVIPWEEEARLTLEGVLWKIPHQNKKILAFDIGGGSTEFILSRGNKIAATAGTGLGTVRLTEKFITRHPVDPDELRNLEDHLSKSLTSVKERLAEFDPELLIGTAGTVTTLAALDKNIYPYDPEKIHGTLLPLERVQGLMDELKSKSIEERLALKPMEPGREDLIIAGTAIALETMKAFGCQTLRVCEYGLREGILLNSLKQS